VLYYGDEIGMGDNIYLGDRNGVRTPMQWSGDRNAGFSRANPSSLYQPIILDPIYHYQAINVESQSASPHSLLSYLRRLIRIRKSLPVFGRGDLTFVPCPNQRVVAYVRSLGDQVVLLIHNLSRFAQPAELDLSIYEGMTPIELIGNHAFPEIGQLPYFITLNSYGSYGFRLERLHVEPGAGDG
jgi:maltose alpha-D-glucosyltransferase / alpha-amylase